MKRVKNNFLAIETSNRGFCVYMIGYKEKFWTKITTRMRLTIILYFIYQGYETQCSKTGVALEYYVYHF